MLRIGNLSTAPEVSTNYAFPLDPFQKISIKSIQDEENVMVTAKTGSGKTLIAEYQVEYSLAKGKRVFYTTPIKSLSNQKFHDLKKIYGSRVGIMTGDIKFAPQSDVVILTTEILRNLLFKLGTSTEHIGTTAMLSIQDVDAVVFDEFHYIMDPERGKVWEECLILLPPHIKVILLSATIQSPEIFGDWLAKLKQRNVMLVSTEYRVVPLKHCVVKGNEIEIVMDNTNKFYKDAYTRYLVHLKNQEDKKRKHAESVQDRRLGGYEDAPIVKDGHEKSFVFQMNETIQFLKQRNLLPGLFFVFSRRHCEELADKVEDTLLSHEESASVRRIVGFYLSRYNELNTMSQYNQLMKLLLKGIAFHHSGLLPLLKEIVELLFNQGLIRILFATETFAVGINMPTKTVIFTSYQKHDNDGMRLLRTDEYIQMAGRAGRRGKDTEGLVLYLPNRKPEFLENVQKMMTGKQQHLCSRLDFHYDFLIKSLLLNRSWLDIQDMSYWHCLRKKEIEAYEDEIKKMEDVPDIPITDFEERESYEITIKNTNNAPRKEAQRKLEQWKNRHMGPRWEEGWKKYRQYKLNQETISAIQFRLKELKENDNDFLGYLEKMKFVLDGKLTQLGILATEVNEGHPLILPKMYYEGHLKSLSRNELIAYFGCFIEEEESMLDIPDNIRNAIKKTMDISDELSKLESGRISPDRFWEIHMYWPEVFYKWMNGEELCVLCSTYGIYEGNMTKALLKASNIADECIHMATIQHDLEMLEKLRDIRQDIIRGIVVPDSLYLRI